MSLTDATKKMSKSVGTDRSRILITDPPDVVCYYLCFQIFTSEEGDDNNDNNAINIIMIMIMMMISIK